MSEKKFVKITNVGNGIQVIPDLRSVNTTNYRSPSADRLKVKPAWTRFRITIKTGTHYYPAEIIKWESVIELEKINYITIGAVVDSCDDPEALQMSKALDAANAKFEKDVITNKKIAANDKKLAKQITEDIYTEND